MTMTVTERDKKLLYMLALILILVVFGKFAASRAEERDTLDMELMKSLDTRSAMQLALVTADLNHTLYEEAQAEIQEMAGSFFKLSQSYSVQEEIISLAFAKGLDVINFKIAPQPSASVFNPYVASALFHSSDKTPAKAGGDNAAMFYSYDVQMGIVGDGEHMADFIDTICEEYKAIRIKSFDIESHSGMPEDGERTEVYNLILKLEIYMWAGNQE